MEDEDYNYRYNDRSKKNEGKNCIRNESKPETYIERIPGF